MGFMITHKGIEANPDKCGVILNIQFEPHRLVKAQDMSDFLVKFVGDILDTRWDLYVHEASNVNDSGVGIVLGRLTTSLLSKP